MIARILRPLTLSADLPVVLGLGAGLVLPVIAAASFSTYTIAVTPLWLEFARQIGWLWFAGEAVLIAVASRRGFDVRTSWRRLPRWAQGALLLFVSTFWISSLTVSQHPAFSMILSLGWVMHLLFAAALFDLARCVQPSRLMEAWHGLVAGLAMMAVLIAIHFLWLPATLRGHERQVDWALAIPGFISVRLFGAWAGAILAFLIGVAWRWNARAERQHLIYGGTALAFAMMIWTTTRAAVLAGVCVLPVAWLIAGPPRSRGFVTVLPLYLIVAGLSVLPLQPYGDPAFTFFEASNLGSADQIVSGRLTIWALALKAAAIHPWLGTGAGSSWWLVTIGGTYTRHVQPHNALVQFLLNWGLLPTAAAVALLSRGTWQAHVAAHRHKPMLPFVLMLDSLLIMSMFDGMLHFAQFVMLIVGCLALCLAKLSDPVVEGEQGDD